MSRFTPGPWRRENNVIRVDGREIARPLWEYMRYGEPARTQFLREDEANASLITAAPELYEALQAVVANFPCYRDCPGEPPCSYCETARKITTALAKAEGRSQ